MIFICCALLLINLFQYHRSLKLYNKMCDIENVLKQNVPRSQEKKIAVEADVKKPGANRSPRTVEQREKAAEQRRQWWARKRALDQKTQEPKTTETKLDGSSPNLV